jgi:hypothetical protein
MARSLTGELSNEQPPEGGRGITNRPPKRATVRFEELAYSTILQVQALVELLEEEGLLTRREVVERVKQLQSEAARLKQ